MMNRVNGNLSEGQARRRQLQKYEQDAKKHAEKEKEKLDKKRAEKWKKYQHIDMGTKLPGFSQSEDMARAMQQSAQDYITKLERENKRLPAENMGTKSPDVGQSEDVARAMQQSAQDYIVELERENKRLRAEEEKRQQQSSQAAACSSAFSDINRTMSPRPAMGRVPFEMNAVTNSPSSRSSRVSSPRLSSRNVSKFEENFVNVPVASESPKINANSSYTVSLDEAEAEKEKIKEETHKRNMRSVRQNMQELYSQNLRKED